MEWDRQQRAWMLALALHRSRLCPRCGHDMRRAHDPDSEGRYRPLLPTRCHACDALALSQERYRDPQATARPEALFHQIEYQPPPT